MHGIFAPKTTQSNLSSPLTVENGESITVYGIHVKTDVTIVELSVAVTDVDDNPLFTFPVGNPGFQEGQLYSHFLASNGLKFTASSNGADVEVTVFHSQGGS